ncbi:uncharacterized protein LOC18422713 isoform X2 [Amborella trichopoda]|uniref:uncharacterized protein LOC18422713 isoform X2 n=1 Tax=Amborella trichopoda TaxID=13333 RepID=UPI0009BEA059|nr:uncharacterized protein LOC18422713 isoform X2 [Amborella trichopoda]|eukprot:XP_020523340.1 uncharacterized protein LOC18422713 isoform X2 [Amborella trichopoda]
MASEKGTPYVFQLSPLMELGFHLINGLSVWASLLFAQIINGWTLTTHPLQTICILWLFESPIVILGFSLLSKKLEHCSLKWAILRGLLGLPAGALVNAFGAIVFGAPVGIKFLTRTVNWALLMSLLTGSDLLHANLKPKLGQGLEALSCSKREDWVMGPKFRVVPTASVYGSSWKDWQRLYAHSKPITPIDYAVCLPAHGAVIGAWFGAWPMPLDWDRPWQVKVNGAFLLNMQGTLILLCRGTNGYLREIHGLLERV